MLFNGIILGVEPRPPCLGNRYRRRGGTGCRRGPAATSTQVPAAVDGSDLFESRLVYGPASTYSHLSHPFHLLDTLAVHEKDSDGDDDESDDHEERSGRRRR